MHDIWTLLRYIYVEGYSKREVARFLELSPGTMRNYLRRAESAGLSWPLPEELTDETLDALLFPASESNLGRPQPNWKKIHQQFARKGMTLERIWDA